MEKETSKTVRTIFEKYNKIRGIIFFYSNETVGYWQRTGENFIYKELV
jgi:hypothetical protein